MCGIAGFVNFDGEPASARVLKRMTDAIAHRGPDGEGHYVDGSAALGHRRLAIIDLSPSGRQPISNETGDVLLTYNGEIYNYRELRVELEAAGHRFHSQTDSEVVVHAYEEWGASCVERFNGMFAFVLWEKPRRRFFMARDRYGIKPFYYTFCNGSFVFASEQKAIRLHNRFRHEIDLEGLLEYFTFQNFFTDHTLLKGVKIFPAGSRAFLSLDEQANELRIERYWDYSFHEPEQPADDGEYVEELERLFRQAVQRQLVSDVDVGSYLSGGMDSGSITAVAAGELPYLKTFTCGFDLHSISGLEVAFDEREKSELMSYLFRTEHYEMVLKAGDMERILPSLSWHLEEPRVGQCYPNYYVASLASRFVKVCLSGAGGDELFGGYPWRYYRAVVNDDFEDYIDKYYVFWNRLIPNRIVHQVFEPIFPQVKHVWTRDIFRDVFASRSQSLSRPEDYINHSLYFEAKTFLHGLFVVEDKISMAHGLETRVPFLDNDLVDFAMGVPVRLKLRDLADVVRINENEPGKAQKYYMRTRDGKLILRDALSRIIPNEVTDAVKQGFSAPDASWFRGESIDYVKRILFDPRARVYDYMDRKAVHGLINEHLNGQENRRLFIWSLLNFEWWLREYLENC